MATPGLAGAYPPIYTGAANLGANDYLFSRQDQRSRQAGTVVRIRFYADAVPGSGTHRFRVWRKNGATYDMVGESENLLGKIAGGITNDLWLSNPIVGVQEGDFYGWTTSVGSYLFAKGTPTGDNGLIRYRAVGGGTTGVDWDAATTLSNYIVPIQFFMASPPEFSLIGDSIIGGKTAHLSYCEPATVVTNAPTTTIGYKLAGLIGTPTFQNMGVQSQTTTQIQARFDADVVQIGPKWCVIEGGVNDISTAVPKATFLANWTAMLDACATAGIRPIPILILPWTAGTTVQMQTRDNWNVSLVDLFIARNITFVDASRYVGQFRAGGDANNLWDQQPAYNADNVHYTEAGHAQIAQAVFNAMRVLNKGATFGPMRGAHGLARPAVRGGRQFNRR